MLAYKIHTQTDEKGNLLLYNLPFNKKQTVEVIILMKETKQESSDLQNRLALLKASFGTIKSTANITDELLSRKNLYENDGR
ncbi:MAG: hypothetical protein IIA88_01090 [Bacteroidetes bacterium]|nr:hypothetical protein [Bacteroidota bacterium]